MSSQESTGTCIKFTTRACDLHPLLRYEQNTTLIVNYYSNIFSIFFSNNYAIYLYRLNILPGPTEISLQRTPGAFHIIVDKSFQYNISITLLYHIWLKQ